MAWKCGTPCPAKPSLAPELYLISDHLKERPSSRNVAARLGHVAVREHEVSAAYIRPVEKIAAGACGNVPAAARR